MKKQDIIDLLEQETERYEKLIKTIESYKMMEMNK